VPEEDNNEPLAALVRWRQYPQGAGAADGRRETMAYSGDHVLLAWGGRMPGGEQWTNTLRMRYTNPVGFADQTAVQGWLAGGFKDALAAYWASVRNFTGQGVYLDWIKANRVDTNGHYLDAETNRYDFPAPTAGSSTAQPNQLSYVVSTLTGVRAGRAHIGRWFIPSPSLAYSATTGLTTSNVSAMFLDPAKTLLNSLNATATVLGVQIVECAVMSNIGAGTDHKIIGVRGGLAVDTQRRRRNKLPDAGPEVML
jgi:hypothetical protein